MKKYDKSVSSMVGVVLVLGIVITANVVLRPVRLRKDITEDKLYTLSDGTKAMIENLRRDVTLKFYFSSSNERLPIPVKIFAGRVRDLLSEYESISKGKIVVEEFDPRPDTDAEDWAKTYGLYGQSVNEFGSESDLYFGIAAVSGVAESIIPILGPSDESRLEYMLTRQIGEVTTETIGTIGIMSPLKIQGTSEFVSYMTGEPTYSKWNIVTEIERQYTVMNVATDTSTIPPAVDVLMLVHPVDIPDKTLYAIDQFLLHGGRLLLAVDPTCIASQNAGDTKVPMANNSNLPKMLNAWGLDVPSGLVVCDESAASMLSIGQGRAKRNAAWLSLREQHINQDELVSTGMNNILVPFAGAIMGTPTNGLTMTELLYTEPNGFFADVSSAQTDEIVPKEDRYKFPVAVLLKGVFKTAFPQKEPTPEEAAQINGMPHRNIGTIETRVIILSDIDMMWDYFSVKEQNQFGQTVKTPVNDNMGLILNMVEMLIGDSYLVSLRSRGTFERPFTRIVKMEQEAQEKWQAEDTRVTRQLRETQTKLSKLQETYTNEELMRQPEVVREMEQFNVEATRAERMLKELRKNLRSDIEKLGFQIKAINIFGISAFIAIFGIARAIWLKKTR